MILTLGSALCRTLVPVRVPASLAIQSENDLKRKRKVFHLGKCVFLCENIFVTKMNAKFY